MNFLQLKVERKSAKSESNSAALFFRRRDVHLHIDIF